MSKEQPDSRPSHLPQYVGYSEVQEALGVSLRTIERMVRDGLFPRPEQLSPNRVGWKAEVVTAYLDDRSQRLVARAVSNPEDLAPDQLAGAAFGLLVRAIENELGEPVDPAGISVLYGRPSEPITEEQLFAAESQEAAIWQQRFADFGTDRAFVVAAWLFPSLREMFAEAATSGSRDTILDPASLHALALIALDKQRWEDGLAGVKASKA